MVGSATTGVVPDPAGFSYERMADHMEARIRAGAGPKWNFQERAGGERCGGNSSASHFPTSPTWEPVKPAHRG